MGTVRNLARCDGVAMTRPDWAAASRPPSKKIPHKATAKIIARNI
jgi:hypothetical protein